MDTDPEHSLKKLTPAQEDIRNSLGLSLSHSVGLVALLGKTSEFHEHESFDMKQVPEVT